MDSIIKGLWANRFVRRITLIFLDSAMAAPLGEAINIGYLKGALIAGVLGVWHFCRKLIADARAREEALPPN